MRYAVILNDPRYEKEVDTIEVDTESCDICGCYSDKETMIESPDKGGFICPNHTKKEVRSFLQDYTDHSKEEIETFLNKIK